MKNLTFTLFFLSFFWGANAQSSSTQLKLTHEDDIVISNATFKGRLTSSDSINFDNCNQGSTWGQLLFLQYNNTETKDFLLTHSYGVDVSSNFINDGAGFSKIAIGNQGGFLFSDGTVNNANLNIGRYNHSDGSILPLLAAQSNTKMPIFRSSSLIDFPNGDWGIVGTYYDGDFFFSGMNTPFSTGGLIRKAFILKFDGTTNQVVWQHELPVLINQQPFVTPNGDIYITGYRMGADTANLGNLTLLPSTTSPTFNFFIAKIDAQGNPLVLKDLIETDETNYYIRRPQVHVQDSVYYVVSEFSGQTTFNANTTLAGDYSFIAKYQASNDSLLWVKDIFIPIKSSTLDFQNNLYFSGLVYDAQDISWTLDSINFYNERQFIVKMDETGNITTISTIPNLNSGRYSGRSEHNNLVTNSQGKVYGLMGEIQHIGDFLLFEIDSAGQIIEINNFEYESCWISTEEEDLTTTIQITPNPTTDFIHISIKDENDWEDVFYRLYNSNGQLLKEGNINNQTESIDIQSLPSGLYFTEIITEKGSVTKKVVKL